MKLSKNTLTILKNFSSINQGIAFKKGNKQLSLSTDKKIMVEVTLPEEFPVDFPVYDLPQFISNLSTLNDPELIFSQDASFVTLNDGEFNIKYFACAPGLIKGPPEGKPIPIPDTMDAEFVLKETVLAKMNAIANTNGLKNLIVSGSTGNLVLTATNKEDPGSNSAKYNIGEYKGPDFQVSFPAEYLAKVLPLDYNVKVASKLFAILDNEAIKIRYFISKQV